MLNMELDNIIKKRRDNFCSLQISTKTTTITTKATKTLTMVKLQINFNVL